MVDAPASGAGVCMDVEVRVLSWAPSFPNIVNRDTTPDMIPHLYPNRSRSTFFCTLPIAFLGSSAMTS